MTEWQPEFKENEIVLPENIPKWTNIGIRTKTKFMIDKVKGEKSYSDYIEFLLTKDNKVNLVVGLIKRVDNLEKGLGSLERFIKDKLGGQYG